MMLVNGDRSAVIKKLGISDAFALEVYTEMRRQIEAGQHLREVLSLLPVYQDDIVRDYLTALHLGDDRGAKLSQAVENAGGDKLPYCDLGSRATFYAMLIRYHGNSLKAEHREALESLYRKETIEIAGQAGHRVAYWNGFCDAFSEITAVFDEMERDYS